MLVGLLPEILEEIFQYCSFDDGKNLRLVNSGYRGIIPLNEMLFHRVKIPEHELELNNFTNAPSACNLIHTSILTIAHGSSQRSASEERETLSNSYFAIFKWCNPTELHIKWGRIPRDIFERISSLNNLCTLDTYGSKDVDDNLMVLISNGLPQLQCLNIGATKVTDKGLLYLHKLSSVRELVVVGCKISHRGLISENSVMACTLLKLNVGLCATVDDECLKLIGSHMRQLEELDLRSCHITDDGLQQLTSLSSLEKLNLSGCMNLTQEGVSALSWDMPNLEELSVKECYRLGYRVSEMNIRPTVKLIT